ncbi:hypothetical protein [Paenibacillus soyae]|uniref:DUF5666 domain-containing protein n=1 Tax=Paenibacillus soyae TaxID=2969249 RepID=A0A9X2MQT3_9BACL|nr:hypothetical protein [Paenibacillus soyae]MCR2804091.1 hypothetical protein [Paenibacillus soyae]
MKKPSYKSAMSRIKTSENFQDKTIERLQQHQSIKGEIPMTNQPKSSVTKKTTAWTVGLAACAVLAFGIYAAFPSGGAPGIEVLPIASGDPAGNVPPGKAPATSAKQQVNIDGVIEEVSADGKSFRIGTLWVTVTDETVYGISGPTAPDPSEQLVSKEFKVGNTVSGFTSQDVSSGKVTADKIYNNF